MGVGVKASRSRGVLEVSLLLQRRIAASGDLVPMEMEKLPIISGQVRFDVLLSA